MSSCGNLPRKAPTSTCCGPPRSRSRPTAACGWSKAISGAECCFSDQNEVLDAFKAGELSGDIAVVVRFQGPRANGMPELHKLVPTLGVLQDRGQRVALITDGRMSGASGKVPSAIHVSPEALPDGPLARVRDGDVIRLDGRSGTLEALGVDLASRPAANSPPPPVGTGRELFAMMRMHASDAEAGASAMLAAIESESA
jgi:phosphogluconate dehydratase